MGSFMKGDTNLSHFWDESIQDSGAKKINESGNEELRNELGYSDEDDQMNND